MNAQEQDLRLLEKQLTDFISWLGENRPYYHEGVLYGNMKDYIARIKSVKEAREIEQKIITYKG